MYTCARCDRWYPVILGIPDFRLFPDPYISIEDDRRKGERLFEAGATRSFEELVRYYYSITPEVPPDLAKRWTARAIAQPEIAECILRSSGLLDSATASGSLLDVGCSTGGLLVTAAKFFPAIVGVDVAFRWLVLAQARLREAGVRVELVCANAEALPFLSHRFQAVTLLDVLEHLRDSRAGVREAYRVSVPGAKTLCTTNNRYSPVVDPHVGIWGVGYLPRRWQARYVAWRRPGMKEYRIYMRSAWEVTRLFRNAGYVKCRSGAAPVCAPHLISGAARRLVRLYNAALAVPGMTSTLGAVGPALLMVART
jgi:ubiquinone/menaquinone biosynthesis C-methylase UbiE